MASFTGMTSHSVLRKKYYEIFPRLWTNGRDIVERSLHRNKASIINDHILCCPYGQSKANIRIDPLRDAAGKVIGARISFFAHPAYQWEPPQDNSQHLVDIGKQATIFAHRIRNPLNAIKGAVVYLREKYHNDAVLREFTDIMHDEIEKLNNSISKFLGASLSELERREADINLLLKKIEVITSFQIDAHKINTRYQYGKVRAVKIDPAQFEQAVLNVINNAVEAMPEGGELRVRSAMTRRFGKKWVLLEVADSGRGIQRSKKSDVSTAGLQEGRGFGLFITRELLHAFQGDMEIKSAKDSGTTVKMYLPAL